MIFVQDNDIIVLIMIPEFNDLGYLPAGIHKATIEEIDDRFTYNKHRKLLMSGVKSLVKALKSAGCRRLYLDGSFVTSQELPADYDAVFDPGGVDNTIDPVLRDLTDEVKPKYFGDIFILEPDYAHFNHLEFFQTDRDGVPKGILLIEIEQ